MVAKRGVRIPLAAAREDCKSCMEQELLEAEERAGRDGGKEIEDEVLGKRAALEEVNECLTLVPAVAPIAVKVQDRLVCYCVDGVVD